MRLLTSFLFAALLLPLAAPAATLQQADAWLVAKDARAAAEISTLLKAQPRSADVHVLHARLLLQQGKTEDAIEAAERAAELAPNHAQAHYWLGNSYGQRIGQVGMLRQAVIAPKMRDAFERALTLDPDIHEARVNLMEFYLQAPAVVGGSVASAKAHADELAKRDPPRGHAARGRLAMHAKDYPAAAKAYGAAYRARPDSDSLRMSAGVAYQANQQWAEAIQLFQAWTRDNPKAAAAWYQLGRTSALSGLHLDVGAAALKTYLSLPLAPGQPAMHHAWYRLGQVQAKAGDKLAARGSLEKALKGDPGNADIKAALAAL